MKILGAIFIVCACWVFGVDFYKLNVKKMHFARGLSDGVGFLKSEIIYCCDFLGDSILKSSLFSGEASAFMESFGKELKEKGVSTEVAFEKTGTIVKKSTSKEVYLLTRDLFLQLGEKDCESQETIIESYLEKLGAIIKNQNEFCKKECVMFKKIGAIVGIGIAVLFI